MTKRERLVRIIENSKIFECCGCHYNDVERYINKLSDCLLENGVIVPPVKVGSEIYYINIFPKTVEKAVIEEITTNGCGFAYRVSGDYCRFNLQDDEIYVTKEEAEKALKNGE